ncbi:hypothetical protein APHAL10511_003987 [Amanita phalloides]|nr:hypothetical protein APHAL10511_003987 [Amanita phalloides]
MASSAPPGAAQTQPQSSLNDAPLSWEGDKMFNIYIYDYCYKRGYKKTARELLQEAEIPPDSKPPINARQGLLFEWWSVFWVLFSAKANGHGSEDALLYTQASQAMQRQMQQQRMQPPSQAPLSSTPTGQPGGPQQPTVRMMNGPMTQRLGGPLQMNGPMPNGVTSAPLQSGQIPGPRQFPNMGGPGPQPNGIPGSGHPPTPGSTPAQAQNFQSLLPNQRSVGPPGGPQQSPQPPQPLQQRQNGPFHPSPTMANSPQAGGPGSAPQRQTTPQQQPLQPPQHTQPPPMGQLPGPSPHIQHLNRAMPPPLNHLNPGVQQAGNTPNPSFAQIARPPSRANTPGGQPGMMQPSPSLSARQPPGGAMIPPNQDFMDLRHIPPQTLIMLRQDLGLGDRDINQMTPAEKTRLLGVYRQRRGLKLDGTGPVGPMGLQPPTAVQIRGLPPQQQPQQPQRLKRSSTTPEEVSGSASYDMPSLRLWKQHEGGRTDSSPPQKRPRPSPEQQPMQGIGYPPQQPPQPQGLPGGPQSGQPGMPMPGQNPMLMMRGPPQMGGPMGGGVPQGGQPPIGNPMNMNLGQPPLGGPQLTGVPLHGHPGQPGLMNQQLHWQYRQQQMQNLQALKGPMPPQGMNPTIQGQINNPPTNSNDPSMHPGAPPGPPGGPQFNRLPPQKPLGMLPPPSPAQNGANKDQSGSKDGKADEQSRNTGGNAGHTPNASGTAPPTPVPGAPTTQISAPSINGAQNANIAQSPSSILGTPLNSGPIVNQQSVLNDTLFPPEFMQQLSSSLDDFHTTMFPAETDINFERDFGQWFNGDDVTLDMK